MQGDAPQDGVVSTCETEKRYNRFGHEIIAERRDENGNLVFLMTQSLSETDILAVILGGIETIDLGEPVAVSNLPYGSPRYAGVLPDVQRLRETERELAEHAIAVGYPGDQREDR